MFLIFYNLLSIYRVLFIFSAVTPHYSDLETQPIVCQMHTPWQHLFYLGVQPYVMHQMCEIGNAWFYLLYDLIRLEHSLMRAVGF